MSVLIIGSGLAGLITGLIARKNNKDVIIFEKTDKFGGNSIRASSGINLIKSNIQTLNNINDTSEIFIRDTLHSSLGYNYDGEFNIELIELLAEYSPDVEKLLTESGIVLDQVILCGGHSVPRTHSNKSNPGFGYYLTKKILDNYINLKGRILYNSNVTKLITDDDVIGIELEGGDIYYGKVIIATGGYERSKKFLPCSLMNIPTTAGPHCTGDGISMALSVGGITIGMNHIQLHPTGIIDPNNWNSGKKQIEMFLAPEVLRGVGGKLYTLDNKYLGHELDTRDKLTKIIQKKSNGIAKLVLDNDSQSKIPELIKFYKKRGLCIESTDSDYIESINPIIFMVTPVIHYTMGGLCINTDAQVLNVNNKPIGGLYAVGEVTGGIHGANRLAGNSLLECCVFGIIAGNSVCR
jgi:FAD-dependent fumarate reductase